MRNLGVERQTAGVGGEGWRSRDAGSGVDGEQGLQQPPEAPPSEPPWRAAS